MASSNGRTRAAAGRPAGEGAPPGGIGARVREARLGRSLTQAELAERAGISTDALVKAERGHRRPYPANLRKIAEALGVAVEYLTGAPAPVVPIAGPPAAPPEKNAEENGKG